MNNADVAPKGHVTGQFPQYVGFGQSRGLPAANCQFRAKICYNHDNRLPAGILPSTASGAGTQLLYPREWHHPVLLRTQLDFEYDITLAMAGFLPAKNEFPCERNHPVTELMHFGKASHLKWHPSVHVYLLSYRRL